MSDRSAVRSPRQQPATSARVLSPAGRRRGIAAVAVLAAALAAGGVLPASATPAAAPAASVTAATANTSAGKRDVALRQGLTDLVRKDKYPAALASAVGRDGRARNYAVGTGDLRTGAPAPVDGRVRAGSNTKTFVAAVVLQLVGEGKVDLDAPIEDYLPKLVRGEGIDGRKISVRQLLNHTSGLPNYTEYMLDDLLGNDRHTYVQPRTLLDVALEHKALFAPGKKWSYSNTNYVLAGLLIEKVTRRPLDEQIAHRVIDRIGLRHTYFPGVGEQRIRGEHPRAYHSPKQGAPLVDFTELDPSWGWAAGQIVSTPSDLNRFFKALLDGKLLKPAQVGQLRTTVAVPEEWGGKGVRYGLGVTSTPLSCGGTMWGHGGDIPGHATRTGVTDDGRATAIALTANMAPTPQGPEHALTVLDASFCKK
ncbi:serine hydrolase domain-containing protein [Streptomyces candidus]|uniref:D-alanyl-D-alanine carboxypeptidase n=1 Tax=Streptomyces candidus TaxID=67283 RepID=A0A7X0HDY8_9ACTN|nr:serine hydrolase domain-containing protein [Streptomyces candidus]MBB6435835.1 D-alanyl-D-alanine carboxypeptidase [Streptomyces candidus]GHH42642.1 serine hydrolase [Streptomyces candidus]